MPASRQLNNRAGSASATEARLSAIELGVRVTADQYCEDSPWAYLFIRARAEDAHKRFERTLALRPLLIGIPAFGDPELTEAIHVSLWRVLGVPVVRRRRRHPPR